MPDGRIALVDIGKTNAKLVVADLSGTLARRFPMVQRLAEIAPLALARRCRDEGRRPLKKRFITGPGAL